MNDYRYILDKSPRKFRCPGCGKKRFVRYVDSITKELFPEQYGRCDREANCGHHERPPLETKCYFMPFVEISEYSDKAKQIHTEKGNFFLPKSQIFEVLENGCYVSEWYCTNTDEKELQFNINDVKCFVENGNGYQPPPTKTTPPTPPPPVVFIPGEVLQHTLTGYDKNIFLQFLMQRFPANDIERVVSMFYLGTIKEGFRAGAITFPFIDIGGNVRAIQVKEFNKQNHTTGTGFYHSMLATRYKQNNETLPGWLEGYQRNELKVSCLFGEHLLKQYPGNPIALVEAPKTAIYGSLYFGFPDSPDKFLWLAVYNKSSLNFEKIKILEGRRVVLFPDISKGGKTFDEWNGKAIEFSKQLPGTRFVVSDLLEKAATEAEREKGLDFADYLIKFDVQQFRTPPQEPPPAKIQPEAPKSEKGEKYEAPKKNYFFSSTKPKEPPPELWPVDELEKYFNSISLPLEPIQLSQCETITNPQRFIENQISETKAHNGQPYFKSGFDRLVKLKESIINNN